MSRGKRLTLFFLMIVVGAAAGLAYGWLVHPIKATNTTPELLRADYKADYVLMVAEIYSADQDLEQASRRLAVLGGMPADQMVAEAQKTAQVLEYSSGDMEKLDALAQALGNEPTGAPLPTPTGSQP